MPRLRPMLATSAPMAPRPTTPRVLRYSSGPTKADLPFSTAAATSTPSAWACSCTHLAPPITSREANSMAQITSSFTALALAPGVLNTTIPASEQRSTGMLFTPAPARAMAQRFSGKS